MIRKQAAWELAAIRASAGASEVLKDHLQPLSEGPRPLPLPVLSPRPCAITPDPES